MGLKIGFFYRMDASSFSRIRQLRKRYGKKTDSNGRVNFLPILEIKEDEVQDFNSCLNQMRKYTFLMNENEMNTSVEFNSFSVFNQSKLVFTGEFDFGEIGEILIDLKLLLENKFKNELIPFSERFIEPHIIGLEEFSSDQLEEVLTDLNEQDLYNFKIELVHFGYIDNRDSTKVFFRDSHFDGAEPSDSEEYEFH